MKINTPCLLCLNGGSSSLKFAVYALAGPLNVLLSGEMERLGTESPGFTFSTGNSREKIKADIRPGTISQTADLLIAWLEGMLEGTQLRGIGHRIVHGMNHIKPEVISPGLLRELHEISVFDPEHLPSELCIIERFQHRFPDLLHLACFDTSFHAAMPMRASLLPIPRRYYAKGIRRYGFHGLSYSFLLEEYSRLAGAEAAHGRIIMAHLGNGASLAAIKQGVSMDTSMGFTPGAGIPMSSRTGDLDPGLAWYLMGIEKLSPPQFSHLVNHESGLLGISETSGDMRDLHRRSKDDHRATEAIEFFCYQVRKMIGAYAAALGGLDTLIFSGGIGENDSQVRAWICQDLGFMGIDLDVSSNDAGDWLISSGPVSVHRMKTNEELMIARAVSEHLSMTDKKLV